MTSPSPQPSPSRGEHPEGHEGANDALHAPTPIDEVVVIGLGQLGRVFAGSLLRAGHAVVPVNRGDDMLTVAHAHPDPALVLVAVAENDLHTVLAALPGAWRPRVALIQNELLPRDWEAHGYTDPTVISVWFEKKKGTDAKPLIASPVAGPGAKLLCDALTSIDLPCHEVAPGGELLFELVRKNVYILTTNIAGLKTGGTVAQLWAQHEAFARQVANEVIDIQDALTGAKHDREKLIAGMLEAFGGDPDHGCTGRSAPARLARALAHADAFGLAAPTLRGLSQGRESLTNPLAHAGEEANVRPAPTASHPLPLRGTEVPRAGEHPEGHKGANVMPKPRASPPSPQPSTPSGHRGPASGRGSKGDAQTD